MGSREGSGGGGDGLLLVVALGIGCRAGGWLAMPTVLGVSGAQGSMRTRGDSQESPKGEEHEEHLEEFSWEKERCFIGFSRHESR